MCDVVIAAANSLTVEDLQLIDQDDLPSPTGLVVLPSPLIVAHVGGDLGDVRAFTWRSPSATVLPDPQHPARHHETPSVRISIYHDSHGPVRPDSFVQFAKDAHHRGTPLPPLLLDTIRCLPVRDSDGDPAAFKQHARAARMIDSAVRQQAKHMGLDEATVLEGEYSSGSQVEDTDDTFTARFLYAFWRLCEQRLTRIDPVEPNHAARVAAQRTGVSPDVRVVRLRQIDGESTEGQSKRPGVAAPLGRQDAPGPPVVSLRAATQDHLPWPVRQGTSRQAVAGRPDRSGLGPLIPSAECGQLDARASAVGRHPSRGQPQQA